MTNRRVNVMLDGPTIAGLEELRERWRVASVSAAIRLAVAEQLRKARREDTRRGARPVSEAAGDGRSRTP